MSFISAMESKIESSEHDIQDNKEKNHKIANVITMCVFIFIMLLMILTYRSGSANSFWNLGCLILMCILIVFRMWKFPFSKSDFIGKIVIYLMYFVIFAIILQSVLIFGYYRYFDSFEKYNCFVRFLSRVFEFIFEMQLFNTNITIALIIYSLIAISCLIVIILLVHKIIKEQNQIAAAG